MPAPVDARMPQMMSGAVQNRCKSRPRIRLYAEQRTGRSARCCDVAIQKEPPRTNISLRSFTSPGARTNATPYLSNDWAIAAGTVWDLRCRRGPRAHQLHSHLVGTAVKASLRASHEQVLYLGRLVPDHLHTRAPLCSCRRSTRPLTIVSSPSASSSTRRDNV